MIFALSVKSFESSTFLRKGESKSLTDDLRDEILMLHRFVESQPTDFFMLNILALV